MDDKASLAYCVSVNDPSINDSSLEITFSYFLIVSL